MHLNCGRTCTNRTQRLVEQSSIDGRKPDRWKFGGERNSGRLVFIALDEFG